MADPADFFFNDPQGIHFPQQEFYTRGLWSDAVSYYLPPEVSGTLTLYTLYDQADRLPSVNDELNWGHTGHLSTYVGLGHVELDTGPGYYPQELINPPWNPGFPEWRWRNPELVEHHPDDAIPGHGINGSWVNGTPYMIGGVNSSEPGQTGQPTNYRAVSGGCTLNTLLKLIDLYQVLLAPRLPLLGSAPLPVGGSGCISAEELGLNAIICVRLILDGPPYGKLGTRASVPPQVFHAGWITFGHK